MRWNGIIKKQLLNDKIKDKYEDISRFFNYLRFKKEDFNIIFQFGQFNSEYPNPITRKEFVLDFDCNTDDPQSLNDIGEITLKMNNIIYDLFEDSIDENLRKKIGGGLEK